MAGFHRTRMAVVGAIGLIAALAAPAPAAADGPAPVTVTPEACATGAFTDVREELDGPPGIWVSAWMRPCTPPLTSDWFRAVWYYGPVVLPSARAMQYESPTEPTTFSLRIATPGGAERTLGLTAVCLADDLDRRVACLAVDAATAGILPVVAPITTADPRVRHPVPVPRPGDEGTWPVCGTCL